MRERFSLTQEFCVYVDYTTEDVSRPFYVGKGNQNRVNSLTRNNVHSSIVKKYGQHRRIVFQTNDESLALLVEEEIIRSLKTYIRVGWGANLTPGGDTSPMKDPVIAAKVSASKTGHSTSDETKRRISESVRLVQARPDVKRKMSDASRGRKHSSETRSKMSNSHQARKPISEVTRERQREVAVRRELRKLESGFVYHKHTDEAKQKMREKALKSRAEKRFRKSARDYFKLREPQSPLPLFRRPT